MFNKIWNTEFGLGSFKISPGKLTANQFFSGSAIMIGGSLFVNGVNYVYHLLMGQIMGPETYGGLKSVFALLYLVGIVPVSTSFAIVKYVSSAKSGKEQINIYHAVNKAVLYLSIVLAVALMLASPFISNFLHLGEYTSVFLIGPILFFTLITLVNKATLQGRLKFVGVVSPDFSNSLIKLLLGLLLVYLGYEVAGATAAIFLGVVSGYFVSKKYLKKDIDVESPSGQYSIQPIVKFAFPVLVQSLAFTSLISMDVLLVKHFLPAFDAGLYSGLSTLGLIIFFGAQPVTSVMFPMVAGKRSRGEAYRTIFYLSALITIGISVVVLGLYYLLPNLVISFSVGSQYLEASSLLFKMGVYIAVYTLSYFLVNFLLSLHRTRVVILPIVAAVFQTVFIWIYHNSLHTIIKMNITVVSLLLLSLLVYLGYNELARRRYAKA